MLRLWSDWRRFSVRRGSAVELSVGRRGVTFAEIAGGSNPVVRKFKEVPLGCTLFSGTPSGREVAALTEALLQVSAHVARRYIPVYVSVPDPVVGVTVFDLDELPKDRSAQLELARWRLEREYMAGRDLGVAAQYLGQDGPKHLLLGLSMAKLWLDCVTTSLSQAGIVAWGLSSSACRIFNRHHDLIVRDDGALVVITSEAWALWLWDRNGRPRHVRAGWRAESRGGALPGGHGEIAADVERAILSYVSGSTSRIVKRIYLATDAEDASFARVLNARLTEPCVMLTADPWLTRGQENPPTADAVLLPSAALDS